MKTVYLLPGIMGSKLSLGQEEIWPPTLSELTVSHYDRMAKLADPAARATGLIDQVTNCYVVYGSLVEKLRIWGYPTSAGGALGKLIPWPYDWRQDIRATAALLSAQLSASADTDIVLLAHSMGGLVARYALEAKDASLGDVSWRSRCSLLITMGTPHRGAPLALVRAVGLESALGIRAQDVKAFAADRRYPSAYQLLPPADAFGFWDLTSSRQPVADADLSDPTIAARLNLDLINLKAASDLYGALRNGTRPTTCRYFTFIGRKLETVVRGDIQSGGLNAPKVQDGGDGTVPVWSGTLPDTQFQLDGDEHGRTFREPALLSTLARLLEVPPAMARGEQIVEPLALKIPKPLFLTAEESRFRIESTLPQGSVIDIQLQQINQDGRAVGTPSTLSSVSSQTQSDAVIVSVVLPRQEGLYRATAVQRDTETISEPQYLAVQRR